MTYPCPRSYVNTSKFLHKIDSQLSGGKTIDLDKYLPLISGTIGVGTAIEFVAFMGLYKELPRFTEIITHPETFTVPTSPNIMFALCGMIAESINDANAEAAFKAIDRFAPEFQMCALRAVTNKHPELIQSDAFADWQMRNAHVFAA